MDGIDLPHKVGITITKYHDGNTNRTPDEVVHVERWFDATGQEVTDPLRLAELERQVAGGEPAARTELPVEEAE